MIACYRCRSPLTSRRYWNSPNAPAVACDEDSMFSDTPGPRPVCRPCADDLDTLDSKGKHLLRKFHAHEDGVGDPKKMVPTPASFL